MLEQIYRNEELSGKQLEETEYLYTLSTFITTENVFPIFYEETLDGGGFAEKVSFCFYYDSYKKEYKVLKYKFNRSNAGYGVKIEELEKATVTIVNGKKFRDLALSEDNWFIREHLIAMYKLFGDRPITKTMRNLSNILNRMIEVGSINELYFGALKIKSQSFMKYYYTGSGKKFKIPLRMDVAIASNSKNVLGKQWNYNRKDILPACKVEIHNDKVVGFTDINFITSAQSLLKQYKIQHQFIDGIKQIFGR